jgi:hypothetical protein
MRSTGWVLAILLLVAVARPYAQSAHVADQAQLDAALQEQVRAAERDRDTVRVFLQRDDIKEIAGKAGIDIRRAQTAVATLNGTELASLAAQAHQADEALAGGASPVTISTTTIVIGLLVLILLIVALR